MQLAAVERQPAVGKHSVVVRIVDWLEVSATAALPVPYAVWRGLWSSLGSLRVAAIVVYTCERSSLQLFDNQLSGTIPSWLGSLTGLT
jgi:hypothetical protein